MGEQKRVDWRALDVRVLVVAKEGGCGDWAAYIGAVPGVNHRAEWPEVASNGSKLSEEFARLLFPDFDDLSYRS